MAEDVATFNSLGEFADAITGPDPGVKERLKREMFVKIGRGYYKWVGSVCSNSREHHVVVRGEDGRCYCPHCREFIEPEWF